MQRTKHKRDRQPTAILTADWHLREDQPICRTDNFWGVQWKKVKFINQLQQRYDCALINAGDTFNHWKPSPHLLSETIKHLPCEINGLDAKMITVYGNHELPQWNLQLAYKSGIDTLLNAGKIFILPNYHWGQVPPEKNEFRFCIKNILTDQRIGGWILVWHVMTFPQGKPPWPGCEDMTAEEILDKYPQFDLIVTGHNHSTFVVKQDGRLLVNPGSLTRQTADQVDHHPCVFLWYAEDNTVEKVIVPHQEGVISREHLDKVKERDERVERFISQMSAQYKVGLSFEENLERFASENKVRPPIMEIIRRAVE